MDDHKSTSNYVISLGNGVSSWNSKKETSIVMSSTKAKYMVALQVTRQAMWFSSLFGSISVPQMKPISYMMTIKIVYIYQRTKSFMFT
jgi:hypothetical protein